MRAMLFVLLVLWAGVAGVSARAQAADPAACVQYADRRSDDRVDVTAQNECDREVDVTVCLMFQNPEGVSRRTAAARLDAGESSRFQLDAPGNFAWRFGVNLCLPGPGDTTEDCAFSCPTLGDGDVIIDTFRRYDRDLETLRDVYLREDPRRNAPVVRRVLRETRLRAVAINRERESNVDYDWYLAETVDKTRGYISSLDVRELDADLAGARGFDVDKLAGVWCAEDSELAFYETDTGEVGVEEVTETEFGPVTDHGLVRLTPSERRDEYSVLHLVEDGRGGFQSQNAVYVIRPNTLTVTRMSGESRGSRTEYRRCD